MPDLTLKNMSKEFDGNKVLHEISLEVEDGEFFTLLGPSGCGKSTTLNCVAGLEEPSTGSITVGDTEFVACDRKYFLPPEERNLGMVFQSYALWPHMTLTQNLSLPLNIRKVPKPEQKKLIADVLDKVGLGDLGRRYPHQLSGGQQQRIALARALVYSPTLMLLDEPLSNLDAKLREQARVWMKHLQEEMGITTVYVTHDQEEALVLSDRIAVMSEGRMLQVADPHTIYDTPATPEIAAFIGRCNFLPGIVESTDGRHHTVQLDNGESVRVQRDFATTQGAQITVAVRPEKLEVLPAKQQAATELNRVKTTVLATSFVGSRYEYNVRLGDQTVQVESQHPALDGEVHLAFAPEDALLYEDKVTVADEENDLSVAHV